MQLRRFKDIIAIKSDTSVGNTDSYVAFHASNMEVAEVSEEVFNEMTEISLLTGAIPEVSPPKDSDAQQALLDWNTEINPTVRSGKLDFKIRSITLNVNQICNLKCAYCAAGGDGTYGEAMNQLSVEKTLPQLKFLMSKLSPTENFAISFVGGEPLLHPKAIQAIHDYVYSEAEKLKINPKLRIVTNGTLLTEDTVALLRELQLELCISIDGTKEYNDIARPSKDGKSTTDKIISGLNLLMQNRGKIISIDFSAITTASNQNLFENFLFLNNLNPDGLDFIFANDEKSEEAQQKYISDFNKIMDYLWEKGGEEALRKLNAVDHYFRMLDNQQQIENHCGAGKSYLMVDAKNRLYSCVWDANLKEEQVGLDQQLDTDKLAKLSKSLIELNNCQTCWARHLCGGGCMHINRSHTGDKHKKSLLFCERTRSLISRVVLYYKLARS